MRAESGAKFVNTGARAKREAGARGETVRERQRKGATGETREGRLARTCTDSSSRRSCNIGTKINAIVRKSAFLAVAASPAT